MPLLISAHAVGEAHAPFFAGNRPVCPKTALFPPFFAWEPPIGTLETLEKFFDNPNLRWGKPA